jgi:predicted dehydrogenase
MDYKSAPLVFKARKALRYVRLYGIRRTLVKVRGQYHMAKRYDPLPPNHVREGSKAHVGLIGCGNYAYSVIAYYLRKNYGNVIRGCMDVEINRAASMFEAYRACYYTADADEIIRDPKIDLVYIASNHASHAEYAIRALQAGKDVHIEKPHVVRQDQLERLVAAQTAGPGRILSIGYNRPESRLGNEMRTRLWQESGELMQNWFIAGHEIPADHWYFRDEEGGRVLGNLCHWTDLTYQMMPPERRYPIRITPTRSAKSDCDIAVTYTFGDGSIAAITFSAKGHAFEGVTERYAAHRGNVLLFMDDFQELTIKSGPEKRRIVLGVRDHGHEQSVRRSYDARSEAGGAGVTPAYCWEAGALFLGTKEALESGRDVKLQEFPR